MLEQARSDILIFLDCCAAASSATGSGNGITEIVAACGFETSTPRAGQHSFTRSLIDELEYRGRRGPFSTSLLHNKVLSRVKSWNPRFASSARHHEMRTTPIYIVISNENRPRSIELEPLRLRRPKDDSTSDESLASSIRGSAFSSLSISADQTSTSEAASKSSNSSLDEVWPDDNFDSPKVVVSVALEEEQSLSPQHWIDWFRSIPAVVKYVNIEGVYKSESTLLIITLPIAIWNLVPANPAISFLGFSKSRNLLIFGPYEGEDTSHQVQARAVARLTRLDLEVEARVSQERLLTEAQEKESKEKEAQISKTEALGAVKWSRRLEKEERKRNDFFPNIKPTVLGVPEIEPPSTSATTSRNHSPQRPSNERPPSNVPPLELGTDDSSYDSSSSVDTTWSRVARTLGSFSTVDGSHHAPNRDGLTDVDLRSRTDTSPTFESQDAASDPLERWFSTTQHTGGPPPIEQGRLGEGSIPLVSIKEVLLQQKQRTEDPVERDLWDKMLADLNSVKKHRETPTRPTKGDTKPESLPISLRNTNTGNTITSPRASQWWCGHCRNGPMSVTYNSACVFCHHNRDYNAYTERPRIHIKDTSGG